MINIRNWAALAVLSSASLAAAQQPYVPPAAGGPSASAPFVSAPAVVSESVITGASCDATACDAIGCDAIGCDAASADSCDGSKPAKPKPDLLKFSDCDWSKDLFIDECGDPAFVLSAGGALRYRFYDEDNRLRPTNVPGSFQSDYSQWRFTPFVSLSSADDGFIAFAEAIDAPTFGNEIVQLPIDENRTDMNRYWLDARLFETETGELRGRVGRQFLQYGDQHFVSPLAWANTFRNFEGYRLYWQGDNVNIDGFHVRSVNGAAGNIFRPNKYDTPDQSRTLSGVYSTFKNAGPGKLDAYWIFTDEQEPLVGASAGRTDGSRHTFGARYYGVRPTKQCGETVRSLKYDVQGAWQTGTDRLAAINGGDELDVSAYFLSANLTHTWDSLAWKPSIGGVFYYGSGDSDAGDDDYGTVYTGYPLGHAYWGLADQFSGQNLIDYAVTASAKPSKKLTLGAAFHFFQKAQEEDAIYNIANVRLGPTAGTGRNIGNELDLIATYKAKDNLALQAGYFWFWYGDAVDESGGFARDDSQTYYFLANYTFGKKPRPATGLRSIR